MCLTFEFWEYANKEAKKYEDKGYKFLAGVMDDLNLSEDVLYKINWVQKKECWTTADIYDYELTEEGKKYLMYKDRPQLFLFKKYKFKVAFEMLTILSENKLT